MPATQADTNTNRVSSALVAFTPRQVLLGSQTMKQNSDNNGSSNGNLHLKLEQKVLLHQSIAKYLQRSGFSKTLKKFFSEAQIEKDNLEESSVDLEEMCLKCLQSKANINIQKEEQGKHEDKFVCDTENASKKKKKKSNESDCGVIVDQSVTAGTLKDSKNSGNEKSYPSAESKAIPKDKNTDYKSKEKKKKKSKLASESLTDNVERNQLETPVLPEVKLNNDVSDDAKTVTGAETEKKSKDKKKKKDKSSGDSLVVEKQEDLENKEKEKKDSKKRKRPTSEENVRPADRQVEEDPKRRKIEDEDESNLNSDKKNIGKSSQLGGDQLQKTSGEQPSGKINGDIEKSGEKSSMQSFQKKQQKGSIEPKTVKAFQRVKVEDVVYADERLQDNSYWAKDGADYGYGAKAEEVLGQVRGRGFRHEKTKKKRGSYRGGQIDLQSHSIKFSYSDDD
ncbi:hypothetical protein L6164_013996 [Bauhinia variegata]|uniref:Uncharacterized protein n=1 Tax=Bauhinia variegata TaxID=167791 RepID=A0ACB9NHD2_BAUVA|nr:hypothetical protein L6164_013996 [Bauhinia variegata]